MTLSPVNDPREPGAGFAVTLPYTGGCALVATLQPRPRGFLVASERGIPVQRPLLQKIRLYAHSWFSPLAALMIGYTLLAVCSLPHITNKEINQC